MRLRLHAATLGVLGGIALSAAIAAPASASEQGSADDHTSRPPAPASALSSVQVKAGHGGNLMEVSGYRGKSHNGHMSRECAQMMARHSQQPHKCQCCEKMSADEARKRTCCKGMGEHAA